jgi:hypothetical protein
LNIASENTFNPAAPASIHQAAGATTPSGHQHGAQAPRPIGTHNTTASRSMPRGTTPAARDDGREESVEA